jgi:spermidine/putrescine transport system substrate-binding protein
MTTDAKFAAMISRGRWSRISRRSLLGAAAIAASTRPFRAAAEDPVLTVLIVNSALSGPLKAAIQDEAHCVINDEPYTSSTDSVSRLAAPGGSSRYDLMASAVEFSRLPLLGEKPGDERVQPVDVSLIPNFSAIAETARDAIGQRDGKIYLVPFLFGYDSVVYNRDKMPEDDPDTQSWGAIFEDKYAGRIGWFDVAQQMIMAAGLYLGHVAPETMQRGDLDEVVRFLIAKKKNVRAIWANYAEGINLMATGEIVCTYGTVPMRVELQSKGFNVTGAWPKEGVISVTNVAYIPKDAKSPKVANAAINAMLSAPYASQLPKVSGYLSTSTLGASALTPEQRKALGYGILEGQIKHHGLNLPQDMKVWIEGWNRVKSA